MVSVSIALKRYDMLSFLFQADLLSQCLFEVFFTKPASFIHDFPSRCCYDRSQADHFLSMLLLLLLSSAYSVFQNTRFFPCFRIFHIFRILEYSTDRSQHCKLHRPAVGLDFRIPPYLQFTSKKLKISPLKISVLLISLSNRMGPRAIKDEFHAYFQSFSNCP